MVSDAHHSSVIAAISDVAMAIAASPMRATLSSDWEDGKVMDLSVKDTDNARRKLREVVEEAIEEHKFSAMYLTRDRHPSKTGEFAGLGWMSEEDAHISISTDHVRGDRFDGNKGRSKRKNKSKRRQ